MPKLTEEMKEFSAIKMDKPQIAYIKKPEKVVIVQKTFKKLNLKLQAEDEDTENAEKS